MLDWTELHLGSGSPIVQGSIVPQPRLPELPSLAKRGRHTDPIRCSSRGSFQHALARTADSESDDNNYYHCRDGLSLHTTSPRSCIAPHKRCQRLEHTPSAPRTQHVAPRRSFRWPFTVLACRRKAISRTSRNTFALRAPCDPSADMAISTLPAHDYHPHPVSGLGHLGVHPPCRAKEEDVAYEEAPQADGRKGIEGRYRP